MPRQTIEYRCLLISPGDVSEERDALTQLVNNWNAQIGRGLGARIELVRWESHATPSMEGHPQDVINTQLVEDCDFGIAIFWSRLGTPTRTHPSGSVEEVYQLIQRGSRVLVYFSNQPIPQNSLQDNQFQKLQDIRTQFQQQGLLATYSDVANLREQVQLHLTNVVTQLLSKDRGATIYIPASGTLTAPTPDVRVRVQSGFTKSAGQGLSPMFSIAVQNHSPAIVYLQSIFLQMKNGSTLYSPRDFITRQYQQPRELQPGQSSTLYLDPKDVLSFPASDFACAAARDEVDRIYRSSESDLQNALRTLATAVNGRD